MSCQRMDARQCEGWVAYYERPGQLGTWLNPLVDISAGGGFLRTSKPLRPGQQFELILISKEGPTLLKTIAEVVWKGRKERHRGMGVRFLEVEDSAELLREAMIPAEA